ncbi:MAG: ABC transporter permease [Cupriavidus necator]
MFETLLKRLLQSLVVLWIMSVLTFCAVNLIGDPVHLLVSPTATEQEITEARHALGLDLPMPQQYLRFLQGVLHGDLGDSFIYNRPAIELIVSRVPATLELAVTALLLSLGIGIPMGVFAGLKPHSRLARMLMACSLGGVIMPTFWIGMIGILVFSVNLGWLPSGGRGPVSTVLGVPLSVTSWEGIRFLLLPALTLSLFKISLVARLTEAGTREVAGQEYIKFARAKGVGGARLVLRHVVPNVLIPIVTVVGLEFGHLIAFSVVTESVFSWPGMGKLIIDSVLALDRPVVVAYLLVTLVLFVVLNLVVDLLYVVLDPRLRHKPA